jgi:hypothetical protein
MGESEAGPSRARGALRGLVAWSYVLSALLVLPLSVDVLLHELGLISGSLLPVPELFGWLTGVLIFLGWPFALAIVWFFRRDRVLVLPAVLFLAAEMIVVVWFQVAPTSRLLESITALGGAVFGVSAIRAWVLVRRDRHESP